jgi:hypothetical protein
MGDSNRDLLLATLALQSNLISQDELASCMNDLAAGGKPLAAVLREHGALTDDRRRARRLSSGPGRAPGCFTRSERRPSAPWSRPRRVISRGQPPDGEESGR